MIGLPIIVLVIGFAIANKLVSSGASVILLDWQKSAVQKAAKNIGAAATAYQLDVTNEQQVAQTIHKIARKFGNSNFGPRIRGDRSNVRIQSEA